MKFLLVYFTFLIFGCQPQMNKTKVIYGEDDRFDLRDTDGFLRYLTPNQQQNADATIAIIGRNLLKKEGDMTRLTTKPLKDIYGFCQNEPFIDQPTASHCSAFLIASENRDLVVTAGHCIISEKSCKSFKYVFG